MHSERSATGKKKVLIVDDHPMTRSGIVHMINHEADLVVCGEAENAAQAFDLVQSSNPDLMLVDLTLPGKSGLELIKDIKALQPSLAMLVVSMHDESLYAERVLRAGARGYITKHEGGQKLMLAVRQVLSGNIYVSETMSAHILELFSSGQKSHRPFIEQLSDREFDVFKLISEGAATHQIAARLHLSPKTVDAHRANIKKKLKIKGNSELISYAAHWMANRD